MKKKKLEYTETQYLHFGMLSACLAKQEALKKVEETVTAMMVQAYLAQMPNDASTLREVIYAIRKQQDQETEQETYLRKVEARLNG